MKQFYTVVLDRFQTLSGTYTTEPYETGWADEAIAFIRIHALDAKATIKAKIQISVDGIVWLDEGTAFDPITTAGDHFVKVCHFGGWMRMVLDIAEGSSCKATLSIALKG
jgi:hypothetical protein